MLGASAGPLVSGPGCSLPPSRVGVLGRTAEWLGQCGEDPPILWLAGWGGRCSQAPVSAGGRGVSILLSQGKFQSFTIENRHFEETCQITQGFPGEFQAEVLGDPRGFCSVSARSGYPTFLVLPL